MKCPSCGADLQVPDDKDFMVCPYCNTTVKVREELRLKYDVDTTNLIKLADEDLKAGNYKEAYGYYNKALESDASNPDAWLGKAVSAGFMNHNINEMMEWIAAAVSNSSGEKQDGIKLKAASYINTIIIGYDSTINKASNLIPFLDISTGSVETYTSVINAMETAHSYAPKNTEILHNLIRVCIHSKKYIHTAEIDEKINRYKDELKQLDPYYDPNSDSVPQPIVINQPQYSNVATTQNKSKGCLSKFIIISIVIAVLSIAATGIIIYFIMNTVNNTVDNTKERITKQFEPLKELKNTGIDMPGSEVVKEYEAKDYHVMNVYIKEDDINSVVRVNYYLLGLNETKYSELIINYFNDRSTASSFDDIINDPKNYKGTYKSTEDSPAEIMIDSKSDKESNLYKKSGTRYVKVRYK